MPKLSGEYGLVTAAGLPWSVFINRVGATTAVNPAEKSFAVEWAEMDAQLGQTGGVRARPLKVVHDLERNWPPNDLDGKGGRFWVAGNMQPGDPQVVACNAAVSALVKSFRAAYGEIPLSFWGGPLLELTPLCTAMLDSASFACHTLGSSWLKTWRDVRRMIATYQDAYKAYGYPPSKILLCIQALGDDGQPRPGDWLFEAASAARDGGHDLMLTWPPGHNRFIQFAAPVVASIRNLFE